MVSNSLTELSSSPTKQMSVGMGDDPVGSKTLTALRFTSASVVVLEEVAVEQVSVAVVTECEACCGQQECVWFACFTPDPDENPQLWDIHYTNCQYGCNLCLLQPVLG